MWAAQKKKKIRRWSKVFHSTGDFYNLSFLLFFLSDCAQTVNRVYKWDISEHSTKIRNKRELPGINLQAFRQALPNDFEINLVGF